MAFFLIRHLRVGYAPTTGFLQRLLAEAGVAHLQGLLPHDAKDGRLCRIEAFPKSVLHLDHQVADTPVAGVALFDVHDVGRLGLGVLLVEAEGSILAPGGEVFGDN